MNKKHYDILRSGADKWNQWRRENPSVRPDLTGADIRGANLREADLGGANLYGANLYRANLYRANLTGADVRGANLGGANLYGADLTGANLTGADVRGANLGGANLYGADLTGADLRDADLTGANLYRANLTGADLTVAHLYGCIGNMREIKSIQADTWSVTYTADVMQIGCEQHPISDWWLYTDKEISDMARGALEWWKRWKPILQQIIETSPAVPTKQEEK